MTILSVEKLSSDKQLNDLRRLARLERRKEKERFLAMTGHDLIRVFNADYTSFSIRLALSDPRQEKDQGQALPRFVRHQLGPYEDEEAVALLVHASTVGHPVLVQFDSTPSKRFEEKLRQSAKVRGWHIRFFRLVYGYAAVVVRVPPEEVS